jgi:hypothetical protein
MRIQILTNSRTRCMRSTTLHSERHRPHVRNDKCSSMPSSPATSIPPHNFGHSTVAHNPQSTTYVMSCLEPLAYSAWDASQAASTSVALMMPMSQIYDGSEAAGVDGIRLTLPLKQQEPRFCFCGHRLALSLSFSGYLVCHRYFHGANVAAMPGGQGIS